MPWSKDVGSDLYGDAKNPVKLASEPMEDQKAYVDHCFLLRTPKEKNPNSFFPLSGEKLVSEHFIIKTIKNNINHLFPEHQLCTNTVGNVLHTPPPSPSTILEMHISYPPYNWRTRSLEAWSYLPKATLYSEPRLDNRSFRLWSVCSFHW